MSKDTMYVIYKDGKRLTNKEARMNLKIAYTKKGIAENMIKQEVNELVKRNNFQIWQRSRMTDSTEFEQLVEKELKRYSIVEYVPKGES